MFAILFGLLIEIQEEIPHFAGWEGGGSRGTKLVNKNFVNKLAFPNWGDPSSSGGIPPALLAVWAAGVGNITRTIYPSVRHPKSGQ